MGQRTRRVGSPDLCYFWPREMSIGRTCSAVALALVGCGLAAVAFAAPPRIDLGGPPSVRSLDAGVDAPTRDAGCGRDGGHDCPLQAWMKENAGPPSKSGDIEALAAAFDHIATLAPHVSAYPNWSSIAKDGAGVARRGRVDAARVACVSCHEQYRARFQRELRELPLTAIVDAGAIEAGKP